MARRAQKTDVGADVVAPGAAGLAVIAVQRGLQGRAISRRPARHARAHGRHRAGGLVPQHHGVLAGRVAHRPFGVGMQVRAADPHRLHAHANLPGLKIRQGAFHESEFARGDEFGDKHTRPL